MRTIKKAVMLPILIIQLLMNKVTIRIKKIRVGKKVKIRGVLKCFGERSRISIGDNTIINSGDYYIPIGYGGRTIFLVKKDGYINIGHDCGLTNSVFCSSVGIDVGNNVLFGAGVKIYDCDFHSLNYLERRDIKNNPGEKSGKIIIGDDAFIGAGTIILKGTEIGNKAVIGAGSVVAGKIPEGQIWAGNPAKYIRKVDDYNEGVMDY